MSELKRDIALDRYDVDSRAVAGAILTKLQLVKRCQLALLATADADRMHRDRDRPVRPTEPDSPPPRPPIAVSRSRRLRPASAGVQRRLGQRDQQLVVLAAGDGKLERRRLPPAAATSATPTAIGRLAASISIATPLASAMCARVAREPSLMSIIAVAPALGETQPGLDPRLRLDLAGAQGLGDARLQRLGELGPRAARADRRPRHRARP